MKKLSFYFLLFSFLIILISCEKGEKGEIGPAGPQGTSAEIDSNILNGYTNAIYLIKNIVRSDWISIPQPSGNSNYTTSLLIPEITQGIVDSGMVIVYLKNSNSYSTLPITSFLGAGVIIYQYTYKDGDLTVNYKANYPGPYPIAMTLKIVIATAHL